jgi:hypothetical protein
VCGDVWKDGNKEARIIKTYFMRLHLLESDKKAKQTGSLLILNYEHNKLLKRAGRSGSNSTQVSMILFISTTELLPWNL